MYFFLHSSRLSDRAHTVVKEAGDITLEPVANNGKYLFLANSIEIAHSLQFFA